MARKTRGQAFAMLAALAFAYLLLEAALLPCPLLYGLEDSRQCAGALRAQVLPVLRLHCRVLGAVDWSWLRVQYGWAYVYAQESSRLDEDTTDADEDGLDEKLSVSPATRRPLRPITHPPDRSSHGFAVRLSEFIESVRYGDEPTYNYVKMLDNNPSMRQLRVFGQTIEAELRDVLQSHRIAVPETVRWSLWVGSKGSTTSMHVDSSNEFNCLFVLQARDLGAGFACLGSDC